MTSFRHRLENAPSGIDDYVAFLRDVIDKHAEEDKPALLFPCIFRFIEDHSNADLGTPGPLVHFVERFYPAYVDELRQSLKRQPTELTVWMVNRILNAKTTEGLRRALLIDLTEVLQHPLATEQVRSEAQRFLTLQEGRNCQPQPDN